MTAAFLIVIGLVVPALAIVSHRRLAAGAMLPSRLLLYTQAVVVGFVLCGLALVTARARGVELFPRADLRPGDLLAGLSLLGLAVGTIPLRWKYLPEAGRRRLAGLVPGTGPERALWLLVCLSAGVCEEIVYRGVFFSLARGLAHNWWVAALVTGVVFALGHMVQGLQSAALVQLFALGFQGLVWLTGDLYVAMAVHFLYDLAAGIIYGGLGRSVTPGEPSNS